MSDRHSHTRTRTCTHTHTHTHTSHWLLIRPVCVHWEAPWEGEGAANQPLLPGSLLVIQNLLDLAHAPIITNSTSEGSNTKRSMGYSNRHCFKHRLVTALAAIDHKRRDNALSRLSSTLRHNRHLLVYTKDKYENIERQPLCVCVCVCVCVSVCACTHSRQLPLPIVLYTNPCWWWDVIILR